jgi:hypothetical protein
MFPSNTPPASTALIQLSSDVAELALLELRLPEDRVGVHETVLHPSVLLDMVQVNVTTGESVSVRRRQDTSLAKLERLLVLQVVVVFGVQHTVCESLTGADTEEVAGEACAVGIDVVERGAFFWGHAGAHGAHGQAHALVAVDEVGEDLRGGGDGNAALVAEFVEAALHAEVGEPILAILLEQRSQWSFF